MSSGRSSLATKVWFSKYWKPVNELGYRDIPPAWDGRSKKIVFLGDSFTAGHGIKSSEDRYSNLVLKKLGRGFRGYNLGVCGADTLTENNNLIEFPFVPDIIIWQYFANDIEGAAARKGLYFNRRNGHTKNKIYVWLNKHSFLVNYISGQLDSFASEYVDYLQKAYQEDSIWKGHQADMEKIIHFSTTHNIPMLVVLFPFLGVDPNQSDFYMNRVVSFMKEKNIPFLDLRSDVGMMHPSKCIVNGNDPHPSVLLHEIVAERIYKWFFFVGFASALNQ